MTKVNCTRSDIHKCSTKTLQGEQEKSAYAIVLSNVQGAIVSRWNKMTKMTMHDDDDNNNDYNGDDYDDDNYENGNNCKYRNL